MKPSKKIRFSLCRNSEVSLGLEQHDFVQSFVTQSGQPVQVEIVVLLIHKILQIPDDMASGGTSK